MSDMLVKQIEMKVKAGEVIFHEGEMGDKMYIIRSGKVTITKKIGGEELLLDSLEAKDFFGEMALFEDPVRSATARATENCALVVINKRMLDAQMQKVPEWFFIMFKAIITRLRKTDTLLKEKMENPEEKEHQTEEDKSKEEVKTKKEK